MGVDTAFSWRRSGPETATIPASARRLLASIALLAAACGTPPGGDARRVVFAEPESLVVVPRVEALRAGVSSFLAGVEGTGGVLELLAQRYGVDLTGPEGLAAAGLDPGSSMVVFVHEGALYAAAGVRSPRRFEELVGDRVRRIMGGTIQGGDPRVALGPPGAGGEPTWRLAWGVTADRVGLLAVTPPELDPASRWAAAAAGDGAFMASELAGKARARAGEGAALWGITGDVVPSAPPGLGLAANIVAPALDGLERVHGGIVVEAERLSIRLSSDHTGDRGLPVGWLRPEGPADVFGAVFPRTTVALLRFRFDLARVRKVPRILRERTLPATLPGLQGWPLPRLSDVVDFIEGDVALGILGVDPRMTVQALAGLASGAGLDRAFHVAVAARLRDEDAAWRAFDAIGTQLAGSSGWAVSAVEASGYRGFTFRQPPRSYSVLIGRGVIVFISGAGEVEHFLAVAERRALPLAAAADGRPTAAAALGAVGAGAESAPALGVLLGFTRLTRELADKGVPPYFLRILNDLRVIALAVTVEERRVDLDLDVSL